MRWVGAGLYFFFFFFFLFYLLYSVGSEGLKKKIWNASRICVSSLRRGHANLLCIVPILVYVLPKWAQGCTSEVGQNFWPVDIWVMPEGGEEPWYLGWGACQAEGTASAKAPRWEPACTILRRTGGWLARAVVRGQQWEERSRGYGVRSCRACWVILNSGFALQWNVSQGIVLHIVHVHNSQPL